MMLIKFKANWLKLLMKKNLILYLEFIIIVCLFYVLYYSPIRGVRMRVLSCACKTDQIDFTDWMSFLPFKLMDEINSKPEALDVNT